jgi:hypothetical protein
MINICTVRLVLLQSSDQLPDTADDHFTDPSDHDEAATPGNVVVGSVFHSGLITE